MTRRRRATAILSLMAAAAVAAAWTFTEWRARKARALVMAPSQELLGAARPKPANAAAEDEGQLTLAMGLVDQGRYQSAVDVAREILKRSPDNMGAAVLVRQYQDRGNAAPAAAPEADDVALAKRLYDEGRYPEAVALARVVLERDPDDRVAYAISKLGAARTSRYLAKADPPAAPAAEATEDDKRRAIKHWNEGIKYFQKNEPAKARDEWQACRLSDPANEECAQGLARLKNTYGDQL